MDDVVVLVMVMVINGGWRTFRVVAISTRDVCAHASALIFITLSPNIHPPQSFAAP